ncbi:MAG: protein-export membrane protein SecD [Ignavibacteria bacterium RIFCSPLOWO2_02_FULL_55_14]|nr:MAG: protein-export membrane protein SecD [Ignavibacteria bacterium RIFCSPLOWO2_02_FULL_55_14]
MKNYLTRILLIVGAVALSLVFLFPTYTDYSHRKTLSALSGADSLAYVEQNQDDMLSAKLKRMKLGLDLQGGMRVVLEVDVIQLLDDLAKNKDDNFRAIIAELRAEAAVSDISVLPAFAQKFADRGIRLNRFYGTIRDDDAAIVTELESETGKAIDRAIEIVRNRVDQYRVSEPNIQQQGSRRIIVELPGVKDENEVRQLLRGTAKLEFRLLRDPQIAFRVMQTINNYLAGKLDTSGTSIAGRTDSAGTAKSKAQQKPVDALTELTGGTQSATSDTTEEAQFLHENPFFAYVRPNQQTAEGFVLDKDRDRVLRLLARPDIQRLLPPDFDFAWSAKTVTDNDGSQYYKLYSVKRTPELTGGVIIDAAASVDPETSRPIVNMEMNSEGSREWARITGANIGKQIAIALDDAVFSAPVVENKITGGRSRITGMDSPQEARLLEIVLKAGALPAPVAIIEQRTVGPSLGEDSIRSGLSATMYALILTVLFMVVYYHTSGFVADFALLFNILFILGVMAGFQATLTLPGIAGIVLTIGMAVDANVLINERIREELAGGKTLRAAIDSGYAKAFTAILDSNVTTFLTGVILYQFGSGPVQGFALTLIIGIVASMFSAIIITHLVFNMMTDKGLQPNFG